MFYENFDRICREKGTSASATAVAIGKARTIPAGWKKNGTIPKESELKALAKVLGCEVADFFQPIYKDATEAALAKQKKEDELYEYAIAQFGLNEDEEELIEIYRNLDKRGRMELMLASYDLRDAE